MLVWVMNLKFRAGPAFVVAPKGNIVFAQGYNMIHPMEENALRPTDLTELIVRKRDKKPIISGGDQ